MKKFLAVFIGNESPMSKWNALSEGERKERAQAGIAAWQKWATTNAKNILDDGAPLGKTKKVDPKGVSDTKNLLTAYTLVEAESHEAAAKLFLNHPHFTIFPGDSVEIMECLPLPKM